MREAKRWARKRVREQRRALGDARREADRAERAKFDLLKQEARAAIDRMGPAGLASAEGIKVGPGLWSKNRAAWLIGSWPDNQYSAHGRRFCYVTSDAEFIVTVTEIDSTRPIGILRPVTFFTTDGEDDADAILHRHEELLEGLRALASRP